MDSTIEFINPSPRYADDSPHYKTWTPEQLMRDYHGELKRELFVRCMEWYTNSEVEAKINAGRPDGSTIKNPNFYAEFKRNIDMIALRDGQMPTEFRLELDKRRAINLEERFGAGHRLVESMKESIRKREAVGFPALSEKPSLQELEAARPDSGKKPQNGRETRDYWIKFAAATKRYTAEEIKVAYNMAPSTTRNEIARAKRIVARIVEIELLERGGQTIRQTYLPPDLLWPGQQIYSNVSTSTRPSLVVALKVKTGQSNKIKTEIDHPRKPTHLRSTPETSTTPPPNPTPTPTTLLSYRMKTTIARLQYDLLKYPSLLPPLSTLAANFDPPIKYPHATERERQAVASCETEETLAEYAAWCETKGAEIMRHNDTARVVGCLSHVVRKWYDEVLQAEDGGIEELWESFLQGLMRRLEDLGEVEREVEDEARVCDAWAREVEMG